MLSQEEQGREAACSALQKNQEDTSQKVDLELAKMQVPPGKAGLAKAGVINRALRRKPMAMSSMCPSCCSCLSVHDSPTLSDVVASHPSCIAHSLTAAVLGTENSILPSQPCAKCPVVAGLGNRRHGQGTDCFS